MSELAVIAREEPDENAIEVKRVLDLCNACRYCEGYCATFQALSQRRAVVWRELDYLTNLCHNCTACYHACQYAPPHEFGINAPLAFSKLRAESYRRYAWPGFLGALFHRNGLVLSLVTAMMLTLCMSMGSLLINSDVLFAQHVQPGAFYEIVSHELIVLVAGATMLFAILSLGISVRRFCRASADSAASVSWRGAWSALGSAASMRYLGGGHGEGCNTSDETFSQSRRVFHQFTMWGFLLCFLATSVAALYELIFGWQSPFPYTSVPVLSGTLGGIGLIVGPIGLLLVKLRTDPRPSDRGQYGMDYGFLALLFSISVTGLLLLALRDTTAMGMLLLVHLGFVFSLFITLPYSKFVHAVYRFCALVMFHEEEWRQREGKESN